MSAVATAVAHDQFVRSRHLITAIVNPVAPSRFPEDLVRTLLITKPSYIDVTRPCTRAP